MLKMVNWFLSIKGSLINFNSLVNEMVSGVSASACFRIDIT
jgi:hypothetical protein